MTVAVTVDRVFEARNASAFGVNDELFTTSIGNAQRRDPVTSNSLPLNPLYPLFIALTSLVSKSDWFCVSTTGRARLTSAVAANRLSSVSDCGSKASRSDVNYFATTLPELSVF